MKWTKELPTEPGWYWWRESKGGDEVMMRVFQNPMYDTPAPMYSGMSTFGRTTTTRISPKGGEWQGPIAPQEGADHE